MEIILQHKNLKDKYLITSSQTCYTIGKLSLDDNNEPKIRNDNYVVSDVSKTHHAKISDLINSLYEKELRKNNCETLKDFTKHMVETKKTIYDILDEFDLGDIDG